MLGGVSTDTAFAKKLFFNLFVLDFKTLHLFPDGKGTNIMYPSWVGSTIMLLALVRNRLTYTVSLEFTKNIFICLLKMNEGLTGLERHEGE